MGNVGIILYVLFWNGSNGLPCGFFVNNDSTSASMNSLFFEYHTLSVVLGSRQGGWALKRVNTKHEDWASVQLLTLSILIFLFTLSKYQVIYQWKQTKEKLRNTLSAWRNYITARNNSTRGQLNNKGGGELHEIKRSWDKTKIGKEIIC